VPQALAFIATIVSLLALLPLLVPTALVVSLAFRAKRAARHSIFTPGDRTAGAGTILGHPDRDVALYRVILRDAKTVALGPCPRISLFRKPLSPVSHGRGHWFDPGTTYQNYVISLAELTHGTAATESRAVASLAGSPFLACS